MRLWKLVLVSGLFAFAGCATADHGGGSGGTAGTAAGSAGMPPGAGGMAGTAGAAAGDAGASNAGEGADPYGPGSHRWDLCTDWCTTASQVVCPSADGTQLPPEEYIPYCIEEMCDGDDWGEAERVCPDLLDAYLECEAPSPVDGFKCVNGTITYGRNDCTEQAEAFNDCTFAHFGL